jgi:hypothetical protein
VSKKKCSRFIAIMVAFAMVFTSVVITPMSVSAQDVGSHSNHHHEGVGVTFAMW